MKIRELIYGGCLLLLLLLPTGCLRDDMTPCSDGDVKMGVSVRTRATSATDDNSLGVNEYRIQRIRIIVFNSDGSLDANFYDDTMPENAETYTSPYFRVSKSDNKKVCVVVNESATAAPLLQAVTSYAGLQAITYRLSEYLPQNNLLNFDGSYFTPTNLTFNLPMYGELDGVQVPNIYNNVYNLEVSRCVARIDVYMVGDGHFPDIIIDGSTTKVQFQHTSDKGFYNRDLISNEDVNTSEMSVIPASSTGYTIRSISPFVPKEFKNTDKVFSFYVPEQSITTKDSLKLHFKNFVASETLECLDFDVVVKPRNDTTQIERNLIYALYIKLYSADVLESKLYVNSWNLVGEPQEENVIAEDLKMTNCYIVAPGGRVSIPVSEVYRIWREEFNQPIDFTETPEVEVLWEDNLGLITTLQYEADPLLKGRIYVETGEPTYGVGNAVVAMKVKGVICWSWHIWVTKYEPNVAAGQKIVLEGGSPQIAMKIPLGGPNETNAPCDIQKGRKDPFRISYYSQGVTYNCFTTAYLGEGTTYKEAAIMSVHNPTTKYLNWDTLFGDLLYSYGENYWLKTDGRKGIFDPCPDGWRFLYPVLPTRAAPVGESAVRCVKDHLVGF